MIYNNCVLLLEKLSLDILPTLWFDLISGKTQGKKCITFITNAPLWKVVYTVNEMWCYWELQTHVYLRMTLQEPSCCEIILNRIAHRNCILSNTFWDQWDTQILQNCPSSWNWANPLITSPNRMLPLHIQIVYKVHYILNISVSYTWTHTT